MRTHFAAKHQFSHALPSEFSDIRLSEHVIDMLIKNHTATGECIFDPFAGFCTTLVSAEKLGRVGYGVERDEKIFSYARDTINPQNLFHGDIRTFDMEMLPELSLSISSPIYMHKHEELDPLSGFVTPGDYKNYLSDLVEIYGRVGGRLSKEGHLIVRWPISKARRV